jgi:hypothetical protein
MDMRSPEQELIEKIRRLGHPSVAEVEAFVDFLLARQQDQQLVQTSSKASEPAFEEVWDNEDDTVYDRF